MSDPLQVWERLDARHPKDLVSPLRLRFDRGESFEISAEALASETRNSPAEARGLLKDLAARGLLQRRERWFCPCESQEALTEEQAKAAVCPFCNEAFKDKGEVQSSEVYFKQGQCTRDVRWVLALHGMNTRGAWQEEFNWMISRIYGHSVPVAIYKYGVIRPGAILKWRQRQLTRQLIERIRRLQGDAEFRGFGGVPDVIAHSFGTWLLGHALLEDQSLKVGRVILTGCILRPDFDWRPLIGRQIEAVLCHYATKDFWARIAHYIIPDSGPSGRRGFNDRETAIHVRAEGLAHSDFFLENQMPKMHAHVWQPFLTQPEQRLLQVFPNISLNTEWRPTWWPFRATLLRWLILLGATGVCIFLLLVLLKGIATFI